MMITLRKRSETIQQNLEKLYEVFKEELKKLIPRFIDNIVSI